MKRAVLFAVVMAVTLVFIGSSSAFAAGGKGLKNSRGTGRQFDKLHQVLDKLDLTADQHKSIDQILTDTETKLQDLRAQAKSSGDKATAKAQIKTIMKETIQKISQQLTPEQKQQFRSEMQEARKAARSKTGGPTTQPQA